MNKKIYFIVLTLFVVINLFGNPEMIGTTPIDSGDTAWMLFSSALVLIMTPGIAFFYGGMVSKKNMISTMFQSFVALGVVSIVWVTVGFSLAFGQDIGGVIGNPLTYFNFNHVTLAPNPDFSTTIPFLLFALFQLKFAIIAPAVITGSFAERIRFRSYIIFMVLFTLFIYTPLAHLTWHPDGLLRNWGVLDFAGGTVVHMSAGFAALAGAVYLGKRKKNMHNPANIPFVILGTALLWFGWFGFNGGSAFGANKSAVVAIVNTNFASASAMIAWIFFDLFNKKKMSAMGACIGAVVGLVSITPAAGFVTVGQSIFIGFVAALVSYFAVQLINRSKIDDTLDVFPCHGIGGVTGMVLTAVFAKKVGLVSGETSTFFHHLLAMVLVALFTFFGSLFLYKIVDLISPIRVREEKEQEGLDLSQHGESME